MVGSSVVFPCIMLCEFEVDECDEGVVFGV